MGTHRKIKYPEGLLLYHKEGIALKIIFERGLIIKDENEIFDMVLAVPGSAFIVDFDKKPILIPWKDYPLELTLVDCEMVSYNLLEIYEKMAGV